MVARGVLPGVSALVPRQQRRRRRRSRRRDLAAGLPRDARRRRGLAQPGDGVADGRPRLRRVRPARRRPAVRRDGCARPADRGRPCARHQGDDGPGAQPHQLGAPVVSGRAGRGPRHRGPRALHLPRRHRPRRRAPAQQLGVDVRRPGVDPRRRTRRQSRPVVSASVRRRAARPELGEPRGLRRSREDAAVLARARRRRLPHRRRARHGQAARPARHGGRRGRGAAGRHGRRPAVQPRRRARHPPPHPHGAQRLSRMPSRSARCGCTTTNSSPGICAPTSCTSASTSGCCERSSTQPRSAMRSRIRWRPPRSRTRRRRGRCPTTTSTATSPATAAATSDWPARGRWRW